jgi:undecaprenyl pyrophosphate synthase
MLASPPAEWALQRVRELLIGALRQGPIPGHVAFVMDGNRRYARTHHIETVEGHHLGFEALARVCLLRSACAIGSLLIFLGLDPRGVLQVRSQSRHNLRL